MSNRIFNNCLTLEKQVVNIYGYLNSVGTAITYGGLGISTIVRNGVGDYTITMEDAYDTLLYFNSTSAHQTNSTVMRVKIKTQDSLVQSNFKNNKTIGIVAVGSTDVAVEPASNSTIYFHITARRSSSGRTWSF